MREIAKSKIALSLNLKNKIFLSPISVTKLQSQQLFEDDE